MRVDHVENIVEKQIIPPFSKTIQNRINWFAFFLAFPFLSIAGNSITIFIFISIAFTVGAFWQKKFVGRILFYGFLFIGILSTILTPLIERHENLASVLILIQYTYWIFMASFFILHAQRIDFLQVSKWIFYGVIGYTVAFYIIPFELENPLLSIEFKPGRNAFVFNMLACIPLTFYYLKQRYSKLRIVFIALLYLVILLLTNGRSGSIIILMQLLLIFSVLSPTIQKTTKWMVLFLGMVFVVFENDEVQIILNSSADQVETINPRLASLMRSEGEGDLTMDKSWLIRKLMIDKGEEIIRHYPLIGVGPNNFKFYKAELNTYKTYDRLQSIDKKIFDNKTSAHNTYLQVVTEFGIIGALFYVLILLRPIWLFLKKFISSTLSIEHLTLISLFGIVIHFYTIANLSGALPWFILGLSWTYFQPMIRKT